MNSGTVYTRAIINNKYNNNNNNEQRHVYTRAIDTPISNADMDATCLAMCRARAGDAPAAPKYKDRGKQHQSNAARSETAQCEPISQSRERLQQKKETQPHGCPVWQTAAPAQPSEMPTAAEAAGQFTRPRALRWIYTGTADGIYIGTADGIHIGTADGIYIGTADSIYIGTADGIYTGTADGIYIGTADGMSRCASTDVPVLKMTASVRTFQRCVAHAHRMPAHMRKCTRGLSRDRGIPPGARSRIVVE